MARKDPERTALVEKLAGRRVIASVSGGKDSAALSLWLTEMEIEHTRCFQDTGWESQILYDYLRGPLTAKLGPIVEVHSKKYPNGMVDLVRGRGMFPSRLRRMCTQELKVFPARDYIAAQQDLHGEVVNAVGIRGEESESRAAMSEWEWNDSFDCEVWRPLIAWTEQDVIDIHQRHGLAPCPLYLGVKGEDGGTYTANRVGCFPCIFARKSEVRMVSQIDPKRIELIRQLETETDVAARRRYADRGESYESLGYHPLGMFQARIGRGGEPWPIDRVIAWSKTATRKADLEPFEDPDRGCMRWGMCDTGNPAGDDSCGIGARRDDMNYVRRIESNVKAGCAVDLGEKTLIVGPNGAGKSTIVNAVELALTGRASDVAGRATLAKDAELATLIREGDAAGFAKAILSDGIEAGWTLTPGSKAVRAGLDAVNAFPLRDVREALAGGPETARKWLLGHLAASTPWESVLAGVPAALHARVSTLAGSSVLGLPVALETARKAFREETKRAETLRDAAREASASLPPPLTDAEIATAKEAATGAFREALGQSQAAGRLGLERLAKAKAEVDRLEAALAALALPPVGLAETGGAMILVLKGQIETKAQKCGVCGGDTTAEAAVRRMGQIGAMTKAASDLAAQRALISDQLRTAKATATYAGQDVQRLAAEVARMKAAIDAVPEPSIVAERRGRWESVQAQEAEALKSQRTAAEWTELAEAVAATLYRIVESARAGFEARVQAFMPEGYRFGLALTDTAARFGLRYGVEGPVRPALSGAEWAIVTAALAGAIVGDGLQIIIPEDRPFDAATLSATLAAFSTVPAQVIIATPTMPTAVPAGWTVIAVGGPLSAPAEAPAPVAQGTVTAPAPKKRGRKTNAEKAALAAAAMAQPATAPAEPAQASFEPYQKPNPCPGCGVDLNVPGITHSKACDGGTAAANGAASVGVDLTSLFAS